MRVEQRAGNETGDSSELLRLRPMPHDGNRHNDDRAQHHRAYNRQSFRYSAGTHRVSMSESYQSSPWQ
jgi:hypothetical protein